jgi:ubiquinone/menaquinone biosynthesis C-methylase UbiE
VNKFLLAAGVGVLYTSAAYVVDVPIRRAAAARAARAYAAGKGKPLLNIGAGTGRTALFGETLYGDYNVDIGGRKDVPPGTPGVVTYADAQDLSSFATGSMGAVLASHVLEHLSCPEQALAEWLRVVGGDQSGLFIVTPSWWAPHTWLHPGHIWYFTDGAGGGDSKQLRAAEACPLLGARA